MPRRASDGRFAPSPTGELHLGNLRTALAAWLFARSAGARFLVRVEDLDPGRVRERHVSGQLADLRALGLDWDGEPERQSRRTGLYSHALAELKGEGRVYRCFCSRREIREAASAHHGERPGAYPGTCARLCEAEAAARAERGEEFALRLRADRTVVAVEDRLLGRAEGIADDVVLVRRDGAFAYNLAVVVDDAEQGIGEVVRGADLWPSTIDQAHLADSLGIARPGWAHVPLVLGADGERLAKRHGSVTLAELAAHGVACSQVTAFLARSLGLTSRGERVEVPRLIERFDPGSLPAEPLLLEKPLEAVAAG